MTTPSTILVTGATGMLGSHIVDKLAARGAQVIAVDIGDPRPGYAWTSDDERVRFVRADITDRRVIDSLVDEADVVVHVAGILAKAAGDPPTPLLQVNIVGTHQIMERAAASAKKVVFASSGAIYGPNRPAVDGAPAPSFDESDSSTELGLYAVSKKVNEMHAEAFAREHGLPWVAIRCSLMFGARWKMGLTTRWLGSFWDQLEAGRTPTCDADPNGGHDWLNVEDAAECFVRAATQDVSDVAINAATGRATRLEDALRGFLRAYGAAETIEWTGPAQPIGVFSSARYYASERAGELLGFRPDPDVSAGMTSFVNWRRSLTPLEGRA
jgi:nucleoside-diphosphate-sugar epimerase